jgi:YjbE family integral membrane protein
VEALLTDLSDPDFWVAVFQIIVVNIVLSGDNAVVIALACRNLPERLRRPGVFWGVGGAIILRVVLTFFAITLLTLKYVKLAGAVLLLWIGVKLILPQDEGGGHEVKAASNVLSAVRTIVVADLVMSLDNVIAVAAAARGSLVLLIFGLAVSIPLMVWASQLIMKLMDRFPVIITLGGALLGWIALGMAITDPVIEPRLQPYHSWLDWVAPAAGALFVVALARLIAGRRRPQAVPVIDLAERDRAEAGKPR